MKKCAKCELEKPLTSEYFYQRKRSKDGFKPRCKDCSKEDNRKYREVSSNAFSESFERNGILYIYCKGCNLDKPLTKEFFRPMKDRKLGFLRRCKSCIASHMQEYRKTKPQSDEFIQLRRLRDKQRWPKRRVRESENRKIRALIKRYNLTIGEYETIRKRQRNRCAICGIEESKSQKKNLCVDHDHKTGKVRGLLCGKCNSGLGFFQDNTDIIEKALGYLQESFIL